MRETGITKSLQNGFEGRLKLPKAQSNQRLANFEGPDFQGAVSNHRMANSKRIRENGFRVRSSPSEEIRESRKNNALAFLGLRSISPLRGLGS
jgi:hypothetical protein